MKVPPSDLKAAVCQFLMLWSIVIDQDSVLPFPGIDTLDVVSLYQNSSTNYQWKKRSVVFTFAALQPNELALWFFSYENHLSILVSKALFKDSHS